MGFLDFFAQPLGSFMQFIYNNLSFNNYGLAIVIFTVFTRLLLFPLNMNQYKSSAKMRQINPKLEELRKKYGADKQRLNEETMKVYQEEKINPMASCLPMFIQFPIIIVLYRIINGPLTYMLKKTAEQVARLTEVFVNASGHEGTGIIQEIKVLNFFKMHPEHLNEVSGILNESELLNTNFLGLNLGETPTFNPSIIFGDEMSTYLPLLLIPIVGVFVSYVATKISMSNAPTQENQQASSMNRTMMIIGPVMTLIFSFQLPSGVLVYWISGYLIQIVQQLFVNKYMINKNEPEVKGQGEGAADSRQKAIDGRGGPGFGDKDFSPAGGKAGADVENNERAAYAGAPGAQGNRGSQGNQGNRDRQGNQGNRGSQGNQGNQKHGSQGKHGKQGRPGKQGGATENVAGTNRYSDYRTSTYKNYGSKKKKKKL